MAIQKLPVNFQDDIIDTSINEKRKYLIEDNTDGTKSLDDVTVYLKIGDYFGSEQINKTNQTINELIDSTSMIDNTPDSTKRVSYAERAGTAQTAQSANQAETANKALTAINAEKSEKAEKLTNGRNINGVAFDGTKDITIYDNTKIPLDEFFVLTNASVLSFSNKICSIYDQRITESSLADVYFTSDTILNAEKASITVETYEGRVEISAGREPEGEIKASITIRVVN